MNTRIQQRTKTGRQRVDGERPRSVGALLGSGRGAGGRRAGLLTLCLALAMNAACAPEPSLETTEGATTYVHNGNRTLFSWTAPINYPITTIGRLFAPNVGCSATLIAANKILTAAHCLGNLDPSTISFYPHGSSTFGTGTRIVQGRDPVDSQVYADWAIVTLNQSFGSRGFMNRVIPPAPPFTINDAGYSGDLSANTLGIHFGCPMTKDYGNGIEADCDWQGGASGGPLYTYSGSGTASVYAVNSGDTEETNVVYNDNGGTGDNANVNAGGKYFAFAPDNAAGLGVGYTSNGRMQVYASDADWTLIATRSKVDTTASGPWTEWQASDSAFSGGRKIATVNLQDNRQQIFVVTNTGALKSRWQTSLDGSWSAWGTMGTPTAVKDVAATGGNGVVTQIFVLGIDNNIYTQYKLGDASSNWSTWCSLGGVGTAQAIAAVRFAGSVQQIFVASASFGAQTAWTNANACSTWTAIQSFNGSGFQSISAGLLADGRVHVTGTTTSGVMQNRIRAADGSAWTAWTNFGPGIPANTTGFTVLTSGRLPNGSEELFGVGSDGEVYQSTEGSPGSFSSWARFYL